MVGVRVTPSRPLLILREPLGEQHADAPLAEVDPSRVPARRLRRTEHDPAMYLAADSAGVTLAVDLHYLLMYDEDAPGRVDV